MTAQAAGPGEKRNRRSHNAAGLSGETDAKVEVRFWTDCESALGAISFQPDSQSGGFCKANTLSIQKNLFFQGLIIARSAHF